VIEISVPAATASTTLICSKFVTAVRVAASPPVAVRLSISVPVPPVSVVPESISSSLELTVKLTFAELITSSPFSSLSSVVLLRFTVVSPDHLPADNVSVLSPSDDKSKVLAPPKSPFAVISIALRAVIFSILLTPPKTDAFVIAPEVVSVSLPSPHQ